MNKILMSLMFALPAMSLSLFAQPNQIKDAHHQHQQPQHDSMHDHKFHDEFGYFYREEDQLVDDHDSVVWRADIGTFTLGVHVDDSSSKKSNKIILEKTGLYLVQWVLDIEADFSEPDLDVSALFHLRLNGKNVPGGAYSTRLFYQGVVEAIDYAGQLYGQALVTVKEKHSILSLRNDSGFEVHLNANELGNTSSDSSLNVAASIWIKKIANP